MREDERPAPFEKIGGAIGAPHRTEDHDEFHELGDVGPVGGNEAHGGEANQHHAEGGEDGGHASLACRRFAGRADDRVRVCRRHPASFDPQIEIAFQPVQIGALPHRKAALSFGR